ncbi:hypothetical protein GCM10009716_36000 [Streptomyces sodiiphilus]|uniref:Uncharacterized protein n=1 Tax=Streptomyces sodiiphilus TaxID=226217 RepID=A0ABN2PLZ4_9ACTN
MDALSAETHAQDCDVQDPAPGEPLPCFPACGFRPPDVFGHVAANQGRVIGSQRAVIAPG